MLAKMRFNNLFKYLSSEIQEKRRLLYVAMTRSKDTLYFLLDSKEYFYFDEVFEGVVEKEIIESSLSVQAEMKKELQSLATRINECLKNTNSQPV